MEQEDLLGPSRNFNIQQNLPHATTSLVLGIISIVGSMCYGIVGLVCGIIGLIQANRDRKLFLESPDLYAASSYSTSNAGRICSIIGIVLSAIIIVIVTVYIIFFASLISHEIMKQQ